MYKSEAKRFLDCLRDSKPFSESVADTMIDIRLLEEIYRIAVASWDSLRYKTLEARSTRHRMLQANLVTEVTSTIQRE